jgi:hypothetical protein
MADLEYYLVDWDRFLEDLSNYKKNVWEPVSSYCIEPEVYMTDGEWGNFSAGEVLEEMSKFIPEPNRSIWLTLSQVILRKHFGDLSEGESPPGVGMCLSPGTLQEIAQKLGETSLSELEGVFEKLKINSPEKVPDFFPDYSYVRSFFHQYRFLIWEAAAKKRGLVTR